MSNPTATAHCQRALSAWEFSTETIIVMAQNPYVLKTMVKTYLDGLVRSKHPISRVNLDAVDWRAVSGRIVSGH